LRVQRLTFPGLNALPGFVIQRSDDAAANSVRVQVAGVSTILRKGDRFNLDIYSGGRTRPSELTAWVKDSATNAVQQTLHLPLPAAPGLVKSRLAVPCMDEGIYYVSFGEAGKPIDPRWVREVQFVVIDTMAHPRTGGEMKKTLLRTIDCVTQPPDFSGGGDTTIQHAGFGNYRESGSLGFLEDKPKYSFFSYRLDVPEAQRPYLVEVDYPDDDLRTFGIALMEREMMGYPPVGGVDSGGTMPVTNQMQTQSFIHYPRGKDLVVSFVNAHHGRRAAASRIRLYRIDGPLPARTAPTVGGRSFGYWIEEGDRWTTFYGAPDKSLTGYLLSMDRWAQTARYMGVDTLMPTVLIYQALLFQSTYFGGYFRAAGGPRDPMPIDALRMLLLVCEKYNLKLLPEFFPCSSEYKHTMVDNLPYAAQPDPKPNLTVNADGQIGEQPFRALYNPIFPGNQNWYVGMLGEVADTYGDSPALKGVSLRCMGWCGEGWNWWSSLYW
ncbi:MAG: hypothetical protein M3Y56_17175, partial [Armatimonadota bacterium]|nr:hypothetical protein [Armatimonadota bacterium]